MRLKKILASVFVPLILIAIVGALLVISHELTAPISNENENSAEQVMMKSMVANSDEFILLTGAELQNGVVSIYYAANGSGCVIETVSSTRSGQVDVLTAIGINGTIREVKVLNAAEEACSLAFLLKEPEYTEQYKGASAVTEDATLPGRMIYGIEGADESSEAVFSCVSSALSQFFAVQEDIRSAGINE